MNARVIAFSGSRDWPEPYEWMVEYAIRAEKQIATAKNQNLILVHGGAGGVDTFVENLSYIYSAATKVWLVTPKEWKEFGLKAGPLRNERMLKESNPLKLYGFCLNGSKGTTGTVSLAKKMGIEVVAINIHNYQEEPGVSLL